MVRTVQLLWFLFLGLVLLPGCAQDDDDATSDPDDDDTTDAAILPAVSEALQTVNAAGRTGWVVLPERNEGEALPYLLVFHATGSDGRSMASLFEEHAHARGFVIVAPDSRVSPQGDFTWEVGTDPGEITPDLLHAVACFDEVLGRGDAPLDTAAVLAAGYSGGASSAPYLATNHPPLRSFAILHGGLFPDALGDNPVTGWLSTGDDDPLRPPAELAGHTATLQGLGYTVELHTYPGGHELGETERDELIDWWLGPE